MDKIWYRNPSKSEVIDRFGGDEKTEWPRRTDKSRNIKKTIHLSYSTAKPVNSETSLVDQSTCQHRQQLVQSTTQYVNSSVSQQLSMSTARSVNNSVCQQLSETTAQPGTKVYRITFMTFICVYKKCSF